MPGGMASESHEPADREIDRGLAAAGSRRRPGRHMTVLGYAHRKAADCQRSLREKQGQLVLEGKRKGVRSMPETA
jgi:hypothetical protein